MATNTCTFDILYIIYFYILYIMHYMFACVYMYIKIWNTSYMYMVVYIYSLICILLTKQTLSSSGVEPKLDFS